jgi:putative transposase
MNNMIVYRAPKQTPAEARRALELLDGIAPGALATPETADYQN